MDEWNELDFLEKLDNVDRQRFFNMTDEEKRTVITENKLAQEEMKMDANNAGMSQLADRLASNSFQG